MQKKKIQVLRKKFRPGFSNCRWYDLSMKDKFFGKEIEKVFEGKVTLPLIIVFKKLMMKKEVF